MSDGRQIAEVITLEGSTVRSVTMVMLDREAVALLNTLRQLLKKQASRRLAETRTRRAELFERLDTVLEEEDRLTRIVDALHDPADNYNQNIFNSFAKRG